MAANNIPTIVTTDLSSRASLHDHPQEGGSDSGHPSPPYFPQPRSALPLSLFLPHSTAGQHRPSLEVSRSLSPSPTVVSSYEGSSLGVPPSPTLSTQSSVQFATSLTLRNNKPDERSGLSSLNLLSPSSLGRAHGRRGSIATFASSHEGHGSIDETEPDHGANHSTEHGLRHAKSDATSLTVASPTCVDSSSDKSKSPTPPTEFSNTHTDVSSSGVSFIPSSPEPSSQKHGVGKPEEAHSAGTALPTVLEDEDIDIGPFTFRPYQLASLLDPKNLTSLEAMGGTDNLLKGLGTSAAHGLSISDLDQQVVHSSADRPGASQRYDRKKRVTQDSMELKAASTSGPKIEGGGGGDPLHATLEERIRVYGENILPQRPTQSLLGLMWLALKDKVLVSRMVHVLLSAPFSFRRCSCR